MALVSLLMTQFLNNLFSCTMRAALLTALLMPQVLWANEQCKAVFDLLPASATEADFNAYLKAFRDSEISLDAAATIVAIPPEKLVQIFIGSSSSVEAYINYIQSFSKQAYENGGLEQNTSEIQKIIAIESALEKLMPQLNSFEVTRAAIGFYQISIQNSQLIKNELHKVFSEQSLFFDSADNQWHPPIRHESELKMRWKQLQERATKKRNESLTRLNIYPLMTYVAYKGLDAFGDLPMVLDNIAFMGAIVAGFTAELIVSARQNSRDREKKILAKVSRRQANELLKELLNPHRILTFNYKLAKWRKATQDNFNNNELTPLQIATENTMMSARLLYFEFPLLTPAMKVTDFSFDGVTTEELLKLQKEIRALREQRLSALNELLQNLDSNISLFRKNFTHTSETDPELIKLEKQISTMGISSIEKLRASLALSESQLSAQHNQVTVSIQKRIQVDLQAIIDLDLEIENSPLLEYSPSPSMPRISGPTQAPIELELWPMPEALKTRK